MTDMKIGVVGLGAMGMGMATSLVRAGFDVTGMDLRPDARKAFEAAGGRSCASAAEAADGVGLLVIMVVNDRQVDSALFGDDGAVPVLREGTVVMQSATVPARFTRDLAARLVEQRIELLDAPVSGGAVAAAEGRLSIMASGSPRAFEVAGPALDACAQKVHRLGDEPGIGSTIKAVNQLMAGINLVTAAEGMAFGVAQGADPKVLYEVIKEAAGGSWMFTNRVPHMLDDDYTAKSAVDIWVKDLGLVLDTGKELRMPLPMTAAAYQVVMMAAAKGLGGIDDAGFVKVYEAFTGKKVVS